MNRLFLIPVLLSLPGCVGFWDSTEGPEEGASTGWGTGVGGFDCVNDSCPRPDDNGRLDCRDGCGCPLADCEIDSCCYGAEGYEDEEFKECVVDHWVWYYPERENLIFDALKSCDLTILDRVYTEHYFSDPYYPDLLDDIAFEGILNSVGYYYAVYCAREAACDEN